MSFRRARETLTIRFRALKMPELYAKYQALAAETPNVHFVGRLATYKYYNMDQVVAQALTLCAKLQGVTRRELLPAAISPAVPASVLPSTAGAQRRIALNARIFAGSNFSRRS